MATAVSPNNPDGRVWHEDELGNSDYVIIDESFCDTCPDDSLIHLADRAGHVVLKSFGKFWGLAGMRLGFAIGDQAIVQRLGKLLGPWAVSGPAISIGTRALEDRAWAASTREQLTEQSARLDRLLASKGLSVLGGTTLFRLADVENAEATFKDLAEARILVRIFPYSKSWVRFGLPGNEADWDRLEAAL